MSLKESPPWLNWALKDEGVKEVKGPASNQRVLDYRKIGKIPPNVVGPKQDDSQVAWCAIFANAALESTGYPGNASALAQSLKTWGVPLKDFALGAIVVLGPGAGQPKWTGHVGFYMGHDAKGRVVLLGGNTGDAVASAPFAASRVLSIRWPKGASLPAKIGKINYAQVLQEKSDR